MEFPSQSGQEYLEKGLCAIPLKPQSNEPAIPSWETYQERWPDEAEWIEWFVNPANQDNNIAIVCGRVSGGKEGLSLVVLAFDDPNAFYRWEKEYDRLLRTTPVVYTAERGYHVYLRVREPVHCFTIEGGTVKGEGAYVVAPPSVFPGGRDYSLFSGNFASIAEVESLEAVGLEPLRKPQEEAPHRATRSYHIDIELDYQIKLQARLERRKIGEVVEDAFRAYLETHRETEP